MKLSVAIFIILIAPYFTLAKNYEGYKVFRMWPKTDIEKNFLKSLDGRVDLDFWADVKKIDLPVDIMVGPQIQTEFLEDMAAAGLDASVYIENVAEAIGKQKIGRLDRALGMNWESYYRLEDIYEWFDELAFQYPSKVSVEIGGSTYEGRQIKGVKISFGTGKKSVFLEGGIHAREWISPATLTYIINELLTSTDPVFRKVAESFDWYIMPVFNPDGYVFTHTTDRLWRKTRTYYSFFCRGVDANRNWDSHWGGLGTSDMCTSNTFKGPKPFSEKSMETLSQYIRTVAPNMVAYLAFHSYSQMLMVPYGWTYNRLDNYEETVAIGKVAAKALASRYNTSYEVGNVAETIYPSSGISIDWVKEQFRTPLVFTYELRDIGEYGFLLPADQIIPNSEEVVDSIVAIFQEADKMGIVPLMD